MTASPKDVDTAMEDDYDEEADSDFDLQNASDELISSSSGDEAETTKLANKGKSRNRQQNRKAPKPTQNELEWDSGDEATIQEQKNLKERQEKRGKHTEQSQSEEEEEQGWRARTRAMREKDKSEKKKAKLASIKGSTIDVDQLWEKMNQPGGIDIDSQSSDVQRSETPAEVASEKKNVLVPRFTSPAEGDTLKSSIQHDKNLESEDMITIKRTYKFAGETHVEQRMVPRSSAEAKLWLSEQSTSQPADSRFSGDQPVRRPLRKISRFDPNLNNLDSFKKHWETRLPKEKALTGPKLNTVEKSKMDWAAHVDREGLQDELNEHAKAKEGYMGRMDFLSQVEQRREEEARRARIKA